MSQSSRRIGSVPVLHRANSKVNAQVKSQVNAHVMRAASQGNRARGAGREELHSDEFAPFIGLSAYAGRASGRQPRCRWTILTPGGERCRSWVFVHTTDRLQSQSVGDQVGQIRPLRQRHRWGQSPAHDTTFWSSTTAQMAGKL